MRSIPLLALPVLLLGGCGGHEPPALPSEGTMAYYRIPWPNAFPSDVAVDDAGRLWFTDRLNHALGVFDPEREQFRRLETPTAKSAPYGLIRAPDGTLWFGESNGGRLGRLDPATAEITEIEVPGLGAGPRLLVWSDGSIWFTAQRDDAYGRYTPSTGRHRVWPDRITHPYGIAATGGSVWVSAQEGTRLYRVDVALEEADTLPWIDLSEPAPVRLTDAQLERLSPEVVARLRNRRRGAGIRRMAGDAQGRIWVAEWGRGRVTGIAVGPDGADERSARIHIETLAQPSRPYGITTDAWGRVWYSEQENETLVVYDPRTDERRVLELPVPGGTVRDIVVDAERGRVWLPLSDVGVIAVVELKRESLLDTGS